MTGPYKAISSHPFKRPQRKRTETEHWRRKSNPDLPPVIEQRWQTIERPGQMHPSWRDQPWFYRLGIFSRALADDMHPQLHSTRQWKYALLILKRQHTVLENFTRNRRTPSVVSKHKGKICPLTEQAYNMCRRWRPCRCEPSIKLSTQSSSQLSAHLEPYRSYTDTLTHI